MDLTITPAVLQGTANAIPSKSDGHRKLICAACSDTESFLPLQKPHCADILATMQCLAALGARFTETEQGVHISPIQPHEQSETPLLDCSESGSTFRFLLPVAMSFAAKASFTGSGRLPERPIDALTHVMEQHGVIFDAPALPFTASGSLQGGEYALAGNVTSQYLSGLLMALPHVAEDSVIRLTKPLESAAYVELTCSVLRTFGAKIRQETENGLPAYYIKGRQKLSAPKNLYVDGDWSNAAFFLVAGAISAPVTVHGVYADSTQGDKAICEILRQAGATVEQSADRVTVSPPKDGVLRAFSADMREIPDLLPILSVLAAYAQGETHLHHAARLRLKECDRLTETARLLKNLGGDVTESEDALLIRGSALTGGTVNGCNDHRMVMSAAIAALGCSDTVTILGTEAVNKSYPAFFEDYRRLGGVFRLAKEESHGIGIR